MNVGDNSNLLGYTGNAHNIGLFDQESNFNFMRNQYNNSLLYGGDYFYSNNLNSFFKNNLEDSMMRKINTTTEKEKEVTNFNPIIKVNNIINNDVTNNSQSPVLNKKTKRNNITENDKNKTKKKRTHPISLDEILEECEKKTIKTNKTQGTEKSKNSKKNKNDQAEQQSMADIKQTHSINISNTNPCIINQNNYFANYPSNNFSANINPPHQRQQKYVYNNNNLNIGMPMDIPHPTKFFNNKLGLYPFGHSPNPVFTLYPRQHLDYNYMMGYPMNPMNPITPAPQNYYYPSNPHINNQKAIDHSGLKGKKKKHI